MHNIVKKPNVLLIDPLAEGISHLLDDDLFLAECISELADDFLFVTSPASVANIKCHVDIKTRVTKLHKLSRRFIRLRLMLTVLTLPCSKFSHIIFQSFEEVSTLLFMLLHPNKRIHLIVTNNLRPDRLKRHPIVGRFFLRETMKRATSVIVHCQYEQDRIKTILPDIDSAKIFIKPFHQMAFSRVQRTWPEKSRMILFVGPEKSHKKIEPVCNLIRSDTDHRYRYVLCSMRDNMAAETKVFLEQQENVEILFGYTKKDVYFNMFSDASLVILTHDNNFEGTLSGIFCDAIASGTPVIARDMAPHNEFFQRFGDMGYLVDYADPNWCKKVLSDDVKRKYEEFQNNMVACRANCSMAEIQYVFKLALEK